MAIPSEKAQALRITLRNRDAARKRVAHWGARCVVVGLSSLGEQHRDLKSMFEREQP